MPAGGRGIIWGDEPMKRIVICCDGTWRRLGDARPTNVAHVACAVLPVAPNGRRSVEQFVAHFDGVGAGAGQSRIGRAFDRYLGGAFGIGLDRSIAEAYRLLVFNYKPGDEIYLFGYSRGAFTARSLAGLVRQCGILERPHAGQIGEAMRLYRDRDRKLGPREPKSRDFRARYSRHLYLDDEEIAWRRENHPGRDWSGVHRLGIRYIGVWDTVGALGVPGLFGDKPLWNHKYQFHDAELSSHVESARHAVAVDERRRSYRPTLWTNLHRLKGGDDGRDAPYQQRWFAGVHGAVGGGGEDAGLSSLALAWVLEGAEALGLRIDPEAGDRIAQAGNPLGPLVPGPPGNALVKLIGDQLARDREGPAEGQIDALSIPVGIRWRADPSYRPPTLKRVRGILDAPPEDDEEPDAAAAATGT